MKTPFKSEALAFPNEFIHSDGSTEIHFGLTKREHFAAMAMQGIRACSKETVFSLTSNDIASMAVDDADALIAWLNKEQPDEN